MAGFSKESYRSRRNKGLRGQGDKPKPKVKAGEGKHMVRTPTGFEAVNRKQSRQRLRARWYEDEEDKVGKKFTQRKARHVQGEPKFKGPSYDPSISNHERVFRQRVKSGRIKVNQGE